LAQALPARALMMMLAAPGLARLMSWGQVLGAALELALKSAVKWAQECHLGMAWLSGTR